MSRETGKTIIAIDLYGTLLDVKSVRSRIEQVSQTAAGKAGEISTKWAQYRLEYSWRLNSMGRFVGFDQLSKLALEQAAKEAQLELSESQMETLVNTYNHLDAFADVGPGLDRLRQLNNELEPVIFSNGTASMIEHSLTHCPLLAPRRSIFKRTVSVEQAGFETYKPAKKVYDVFAQQVEKANQEVWLVSSNPFDIVGARAAGMPAVWVNRTNAGWTDGLGMGTVDSAWRPTAERKDLLQAVQYILSRSLAA